MRRSITAQFTVTFVLVSAVVVAGFVVISFTAGHLQTTDHQRAGSTRAIIAAQELEESVLNLETGLRGYLLSRRPRFLDPYNDALFRYPGLARSLLAATAGDPRAHGLSLAISKAIAESHGGTLDLADEDGPGTVFVVELPLTMREEVLT